MRNRFYSYSQDYINRWIISYADFITLLLAVFMVMYALSQLDMNPVEQIQNSTNKSFQASASPQNAEDFEKIDPLKEKHDLLRVFGTTNAEIKSDDVKILDQGNQADILKGQMQNAELQITKESSEFENLQSKINKDLGKINGISITRESRGLIIRLNDAVLFDPGSDIIKDKARITLDKLAEILKEIPNPIRIEGHTDNNPIKTKKFPSNWELSTARSTNIVRYLINNYGFSPARLSAIGYGEYMPVKANNNVQGQAANRRVDIVVLSSTSNIFNPESENIGKLE